MGIDVLYFLKEEVGAFQAFANGFIFFDPSVELSFYE